MQLPAVLDEATLVASICRESFSDFVKEFWSEVPGAGDVIWNWHMDVLCEEFQKVAERVFAGLPREYDAVFNISPGTSKTSIISILAPAWIWSRMPSARIISASHTDTLALDTANKARYVIKSDKYQKCFPEVQLRDDQDVKSYYANTQGGDRFTCTVGGKAPMGFHGHFQIVDDPIDPKKALSEVELKNAREFVCNVLPTRKVDKQVSVMFLVMQRLHEADPTGVLLDNAKKEHGTPIRHICLPAELPKSGDGAYLPANVSPVEHVEKYRDGLMDPVRLPRHVLRQYRVTLGAYGYSGQFEQNPVPHGGGMFKAEYFTQLKKASPYHAKRIRYWDRAATQDGGCYTAGVLMARDEIGNYYVEHVVHGQWEPDERNAVMLATAQRDHRRYGPMNPPLIYVEAEGGSSGRDAWKAVARVLAGFPVFEDRVSGRKEVRAEPWSAQLAAKNVFMVEDGTWDLQNYIDEHLAFPLGRFKDQVDASCFVAGTWITTSDGYERIENVRAGDYVLTRHGMRKVLWSGQSGAVNRLVSVLFSNGSYITGTYNHLVWTLNRGWIRLGELLASDTVVGNGLCSTDTVKSAVWRSLENASLSAVRESVQPSGGGMRVGGSTNTTQSCLMASSIDGDCQMESIFTVAADSCTETYGDWRTAIFPLATISITSTGTRLTTRLRILGAYRQKNTLQSIRRTGGLKNTLRTWKESVRRQLLGILRNRGDDGIPNTLGQRSALASVENTSAVSAASGSCPAPQCHQNTVLAYAVTDSEKQVGGERNPRNVPSAARRSWGTVACDAVHGNVAPIGDGLIPVYDLTVDGDHEFFANGILVHNSGGFNLLAGQRAAGTLRVYSGPNKSVKGMRIVVVSHENLASVAIDEHPTLMVSLQDVGDDAPPHALDRLLDVPLVLNFCDMDPAEHQETWGDPIPPYGKPASELVMQKDHAQRLWRYLLKDRGKRVEVLVLVDGGDRRAKSVAYAVCDCLSLTKSESVWEAENPESRPTKDAPNRHVYETTRAGKF